MIMATLDNLKVKDLRQELEDRDLDTSGKKEDLKKRLSEYLISIGEDPDTYVFESLETKLLEIKLQENSRNIETKLLENSQILETKMQENSQNIERLQEKLLESSQNLEIKLHEKLLENARNLENRQETFETRLHEELLEHKGNLDNKLRSLEEQLQENLKIVDNKIKEIAEKADKDDILNAKKFQVTATDSVIREVKSSIKPPTFDGTTSWDNYKKQFDAAARANGWTTQEKAISLTMALRGNAVDILQTLPESELNDFEKLVKAVEVRYGHAHLEQVFQLQLKNRIQKSSETLQEFQSDIARLVRYAYPNAPETLLETLGVHAFVDGIRDVQVQQALRMARPRTIVDALTHALEVEVAKETSRGHARLRGVELEENGRRSLRCWHCGELGHTRIKCKKFLESMAKKKQEN